MPSPFPGMDPYLEAHWGDVHTRLTLYACDQIQSQLARDLRARVEEYLSVTTEEPIERRYVPDVRIIERPEFHSSASSGGVAVADVAEVAEPLIFEVISEPRTLRSIRIVDTGSGNRVVTAIEFLSPANKLGRAGRKQYREKRRDLLDGGANCVEIDLTRRGRSVLAAPENLFHPSIRTAYRICVVRPDHRDRFEVYPIPLQSPLPTFRIPLRRTDKEVLLNLQDLVNRAWQLGSYDDIDYRIDPYPPLRGEEAAWADALLRAKGLRP